MLTLSGTTDSGTTDDCETEFSLENGNSQQCGACNTPCGNFNNPFQSCCKGSCLCGVFNNTADPTSEECTAAVQCSEHEYCDQALGICQPSARYQFSCGRNLGSFFDYSPTNMNTLRSCGSCSDTYTAMIVNSSCTAYNNANCGGKGACLNGQTCQAGNCTCSISPDKFFEWQPAIDVDLDGINRVDPTGQPVQGCFLDLTTEAIALGFSKKVNSYLKNWAQCIEAYNTVKKANVKRFTAADFGNEAIRQTYCTDIVGLCSTAFCDALYANFTGQARSSFCNSLISLMSFYKSCTSGYHLNGQNPDPSCATSWAIQFEGKSGFTNLDLFNFLGCDVPRPDMVYILPGNIQPDVYMYRRDVSSKYLASGQKPFFLNAVMFSSIVLILIIFVLF